MTKEGKGRGKEEERGNEAKIRNEGREGREMSGVAPALGPRSASGTIASHSNSVSN